MGHIIKLFNSDMSDIVIENVFEFLMEHNLLNKIFHYSFSINPNHHKKIEYIDLSNYVNDPDFIKMLLLSCGEEYFCEMNEEEVFYFKLKFG